MAARARRNAEEQRKAKQDEDAGLVDWLDDWLDVPPIAGPALSMLVGLNIARGIWETGGLSDCTTYTALLMGGIFVWVTMSAIRLGRPPALAGGFLVVVGIPATVAAYTQDDRVGKILAVMAMSVGLAWWFLIAVVRRTSEYVARKTLEETGDPDLAEMSGLSIQWLFGQFMDPLDLIDSDEDETGK